MNKKKAICIPVIIVFLVYIGTSLFLINKKPDISKIPKAKQMAEYTKPAVVRIASGVVVKWNYRPISYDYSYFPYAFDSAVIQFLKDNQYYTSLAYQGSGAIISSNGYIVTNAHVVQLVKLDDTKLRVAIYVDVCTDLAKFINDKYKTNFTAENIFSLIQKNLTIESVNKLTKVYLPGGGEAADGEIKSYGAPTGEDGKDVAVIKIEKTNLPSVMLGDSEKIQLQDYVQVFGYPAAADSQLLSKESQLVVTITDGKVSATDKKSAQGAPILQIDAPVTHGSSGGPVLDEDGNIIGLTTFRSENNPKETQGFNFVVPVNTVKEFVSQAGAKNEEGDVNRLYKQGLQLYWSGYYKDALVNFEATQRLYPNHSELKKLIAECQQKSSQSKILWSKYKNVAIGTDVLALICIIALIYLGFIHDRKRKNNNEENIKEIKTEDNNKSLKKESDKEADSKNSTNKDTISLEENKNLNKNIKARLYAISGPLEGKIVEFEGEPITVGRDPRLCKLVFPQDFIKIARKHCTISYDSEKKIFQLEDNGTESGTFLGNGERINSNEKKYLKSGDSFYLSISEYLFEVWLE